MRSTSAFNLLFRHFLTTQRNQGVGIGHNIFTTSSLLYERPFQYLPIIENYPYERAKELGAGYRKRAVKNYLLALQDQGKGLSFKAAATLEDILLQTKGLFAFNCVAQNK